MKQSGKAKHIEVGKLGEKLAEKHLIARGFTPVERNYRKKWGEIDLVMRRAAVVHFIEVKSVSYETSDDLAFYVSRGTSSPEQNVHFAKLQRLNRAIESWIAENNYEGEYQLDVVTVRMVPREKRAIVDYIPHIYLE